eukprot:5273141-Prymnesium_polylepis.1
MAKTQSSAKRALLDLLHTAYRDAHFCFASTTRYMARESCPRPASRLALDQRFVQEPPKIISSNIRRIFAQKLRNCA